MMNVVELSERLGIGKDKSAQLMRSKGFPSIRIGRRWIVDSVAFEKWYAMNIGRTVAKEQSQKMLHTKPQSIQLIDINKLDWNF